MISQCSEPFWSMGLGLMFIMLGMGGGVFLIIWAIKR